MVPQPYVAFSTDSASAAGALIGLLFVAIALRPDSVFSVTGSTVGRALAGSTFTALVNAFIVSLMATIPKINLGIIAAAMSVSACSARSECTVTSRAARRTTSS